MHLLSKRRALNLNMGWEMNNTHAVILQTTQREKVLLPSLHFVLDVF